MSKVDQFESVFRSAIKSVYKYERMEFSSILIVTDLEGSRADEFSANVKKFMSIVGTGKEVQWTTLLRDDFKNTRDLLNYVDSNNPDLIFTYRNLFSDAWCYPHSLGEYLDVLVQKSSVPVMVLPNPRAESVREHAMIDTNTVMVITDHMLNDHSLINYALRFTEDKGLLWLAHIEDAAVFDRYIEVISKIPSIDTDDARIKIPQQLLKEPRDYIEGVRETVRTNALPITIESIVDFGHRLTEYTRYIDEHKIDLLVMNSKDEQQLAMHGLAYPLAVELRNIPLLMV